MSDVFLKEIVFAVLSPTPGLMSFDFADAVRDADPSPLRVCGPFGDGHIEVTYPGSARDRLDEIAELLEALRSAFAD